jgi:hypothetical protein
MFKSPLVSFVYERGWWKKFARRGFPGPGEEFKMAQKFLEPAVGVFFLVDASCGSGLFSQRFSKCELPEQTNEATGLIHEKDPLTRCLQEAAHNKFNVISIYLCYLSQVHIILQASTSTGPVTNLGEHTGPNHESSHKCLVYLFGCSRRHEKEP